MPNESEKDNAMSSFMALMNKFDVDVRHHIRQMTPSLYGLMEHSNQEE